MDIGYCLRCKVYLGHAASNTIQVPMALRRNPGNCSQQAPHHIYSALCHNCDSLILLHLTTYTWKKISDHGKHIFPGMSLLHWNSNYMVVSKPFETENRTFKSTLNVARPVTASNAMENAQHDGCDNKDDIDCRNMTVRAWTYMETSASLIHCRKSKAVDELIFVVIVSPLEAKGHVWPDWRQCWNICVYRRSNKNFCSSVKQ